MAIGSAARKAKTSAASKPKNEAQADARVSAPLEGYAERSATLRLYIKDWENIPFSPFD